MSTEVKDEMPDTKPLMYSLTNGADGCMDTDATMKEINFLLAGGNKSIKIDETPVFNIRLIAEVKARPFLYDQADEGYNLIAWRNSAWNEIAEALETTPEHVKTRWKTLRDRYKKEEKKERNSKKPSSWVFQRPLRFIQAHLKDRHTEDHDQMADAGTKAGHVSPIEATINFIESELIRNNQDNTSTSEVSSAASTSSSSHQETTTTSSTPPSSTSMPIPIMVTPSPSAASSSSASGNPAKRARVSLTDQTAVTARDVVSAASTAASLGLFADMFNRHSATEEVEDEIFGRMVALKLSKLEPRTKELAKMQVLKALFDAQFGT